MNAHRSHPHERVEKRSSLGDIQGLTALPSRHHWGLQQGKAHLRLPTDPLLPEGELRFSSGASFPHRCRQPLPSQQPFFTLQSREWRPPSLPPAVGGPSSFPETKPQREPPVQQGIFTLHSGSGQGCISEGARSLPPPRSMCSQGWTWQEDGQRLPAFWVGGGREPASAPPPLSTQALQIRDSTPRPIHTSHSHRQQGALQGAASSPFSHQDTWRGEGRPLAPRRGGGKDARLGSAHSALPKHARPSEKRAIARHWVGGGGTGAPAIHTLRRPAIRSRVPAATPLRARGGGALTSLRVMRCRPSLTTAKLPLPSVPSIS